MSSPAGFDEKTAVFDGKKFGLSVPAPGVDMASPLHHRGGKLFDKSEFTGANIHGCSYHIRTTAPFIFLSKPWFPLRL